MKTLSSLGWLTLWLIITWIGTHDILMTIGGTLLALGITAFVVGENKVAAIEILLGAVFCGVRILL